MTNNKQQTEMTKEGMKSLLGAMAMMSVTSAYTNAYEGLTDTERPYSRSVQKTPLTNKQKKARAKSKASRKARKITRR
jgi:hypothetical protein